MQATLLKCTESDVHKGRKKQTKKKNKSFKSLLKRLKLICRNKHKGNIFIMDDFLEMK